MQNRHVVELLPSGKSFQAADQVLLDCMLASGLAVPFSCMRVVQGQGGFRSLPRKAARARRASPLLPAGGGRDVAVPEPCLQRPAPGNTRMVVGRAGAGRQRTGDQQAGTERGYRRTGCAARSAP